MNLALSSLFVDCVIWLATSAWDPIKDVHQDLMEGINVIPVATFEHILRSDPSRLQQTPGLVLLRPVGVRLPLLHLAYGTEQDRDVLRMTIVLVGSDMAGRLATAWRFEAPEGPGEHCYWHCQPVRELRGGAQVPPLDRLPDGFFDDMPTLPLAARSPDELLVALLVSLYGHRSFDRMQQEEFSGLLDAPLGALEATN